MELEVLLEGLAEVVSKGDSPRTEEIVKEGLAEGIPAERLLNDGLVAGMEIVNNRFKKHIIYIPEVLVAGRAMKMGITVLESELSGINTKPVGKFLIGTIQNDLHDIGKNLVAIMVKGKGVEVKDLGVDVSPEKFVKEVKVEKPDLIGLSALLTTTMGAMEKTVKALKAAGVTAKIMVGGAPITQAYADKIGADSYAPNASSAANIAVEFLKNNQPTQTVEVKE